MVTDWRGAKHRLVLVRNPWGVETYEGRWSDTSDLWTDDLLAQADHTIRNDGDHYMLFEDYYKQMEYTDVNLNTSNMHHSGILMEDDDAPYKPTDLFGDGVLYNSHTVTVKSPVD